MAEKKQDLSKQIPNNVIPLGPVKCKSAECKHKPTRAEFCEEHFEWFKAGLITKEGVRASDFDKKFHHYQSGKKRAS